MNQKILKKILSIMLIITLTFAHFVLLAVSTGKTYAANVKYEGQETNINKTDVSFDAYFVSEEGQKIHQKVTEMNNRNLKLFLSITVTKGYLKESVITIGNANFKLVKGEEIPNGVQNIDENNNTVILNQINKGETRQIEIPIEVVKDEKFSLNNFSKDAEIKLTGKFVNNSGKEIKVEKTIIVNLALSEEVESNLTGRISKYAIFEEKGNKKALLQILVSSKIVNNLLPVKSTEIAFRVPTLFGKEAEKVNVTSSSTKATNGKDGTEFNENNYKYTEGIIILKVVNEPDSNGKVNWAKDSTDEYIINLVYSLEENEKAGNDSKQNEVEAGNDSKQNEEKADNDSKQNEVDEAKTTSKEDEKVISEETDKIELEIASRLLVYNNEEKEVRKEISGELKLPEESKNVVSYAINSKEKEIAKGYMLVNGAANTEFTQQIKVNIGHNSIVNNIEINKNREYYTDEAGQNYQATTYYKQISVKRENLIKILGENGTINIVSGGITIKTLDKENTSYTIEEETTDIQLVTSKPESEGILTIETTKYIKPVEYNEEITKNINKLTTCITGKTDLLEEATTEISLVQPTLKITSGINSSNLSTVIENENVELRVALQTNNNTNRLFKNPVIEIELPSYIEEINVKKINILYNAELKAKTGDIVINDKGNKVIRIILEGEQTKFNEVLSVEGTTLIIGANIKVDKTAPSITQKMNVKVINNYQEIVETSSNITYMAPTGIITLNSISGYNNEQEELTSMSGEQKTGKIDVSAKSKIATQTITIINNNDYTCGEVSILGRTPTQGNKSLSTNNDLGSTFTAKMVSTIKAIEGVESGKLKVYYSGNENATKDLSNSNNGWTENVQSLETIKSYLIQVENEMVKGDKLVFSYDIEIPEGLSREQSTYSAYQVSYKNKDGALQGIQETVSSPIIGLSTGTGPELNVEVSADVENGQKVKEGQTIEYTIKVTNTGKTEVNDIAVEAPIPEWSYYTNIEQDSTGEIYEPDSTIKKYTETIKNLKAGETQEEKFLLTVGSRIEKNEASKSSTTVEVEANATADDEGKPVTFTSNKMVNEKVKAYFDLKVRIGEYSTYEPGKTLKYFLYIDKLGTEEINNVQINCEIPNGLKYISTKYNEELLKQKIEGSKITWSIDKMTRSEDLVLEFEIDQIKDDKEIPLKITGKCDESNEIVESNTETIKVGKPKLEISHSSNNTNGNMTEGDEIVYTIVVKNVGGGIAYNTKVTDFLSDGLSLRTVKYTLGEETSTNRASGKEYSFTIDIPSGETLIMELTAEASEIEDDKTEVTVSNKFEVEANDIEKISSSTIQHKVSKTVYKVDDDDQMIETSSISGLAWLDENSNGIRDIDEKTLAQIPVILINERGETVASSITGENGAYTLDDLVPGNYIVVFLYDMGNYDVTTYGIGEETTNNDAVTMKVKIDGTETPCAATNVIKLTSNIYNVDLGLVVNKKFDLSLTKTISKITVKTSKGTTTENYNNSKLQKVEIPSKYLDGATVTIEYAITVKNDGAIAGYASRIIDYLSSTDLKFNSETNADWYLGTDGNIYNSSLANKLLQPGESSTLKLVLTKKVTENNTGLTNNTAEIYEAFNDEGLEDYNSTPANKAQNENDLGQADIIIGPKTGVVLYIGFAITFMSIMAVGIYILNKKVINKI